ncbi:MAG: DUF5591 domain-containing protein [Candidatus Hermodarchaeota archaeon]
MVFEINISEGWGRVGSVFGKDGFSTPNILKLRFFSHKQNLYFRQKDLLLNSSKFHKELLYSSFYNNINADIFENSSISNSFPFCFIYQSLQMQKKSLDDIQCFEDLFPIKINEISQKIASYHLIPWDLPTIYLDHFDKYIETLNSFKKPKFNEKTKLILNIPFSLEILRKKLPMLLSDEIAIISLGDISSLLSHPMHLIRYVTYVKSWISPNVMLYAPGVPPSYIPILVYLGIDLFDFLYGIMHSMSPTISSELIMEQNVTKDSFLQILDQTRSALERGKLRDVVRIYANSFPPLKSLLRFSDQMIQFEEGTPIYRTNTLYCTDETDFNRPEVTRFRKRVQARYYPPFKPLGLIFLPCSAKKPYSNSKSHGFFRNVIRRNLKRKRHFIDEVILTSPLSVVPRNLEYTYPAAHYDIPVTGDWNEIEKKHLTEDLRHFLSKFDRSIPLLGYLNGTEREILKEVCKSQNHQIYLLEENLESLTSKEGLQRFSSLLREAFSDIKSAPKSSKQLEFLRVIADFQFGKGIGSILIPENVKIYGRKEHGMRVRLDGKHLVTFRPEIGFLTLSILAGERLLGYTKNIVTFDGEKISGSTIFVKAITRADAEIRPNDEVLIVDKDGTLMATGKSYLSGNLLVKMSRGKGVSIREKV